MKKVNFITAVLIGAFFSFVPSVMAVNYYWDTTAGAGNGVGGGPANVTTTSSNWSTDPLGSASLTAGTLTSTGAMATSDLFFQVTSGAVTLSSASIYMNSITVNSTGYTFANNSTTSNRYLNSSNGITLGNGVTLNLSSGLAPSSGSGSLGIMGNITNAAGVTGYGTVAITGASGDVAGTGIRVGYRNTNSGAGAVDWWANLNIKTTGSSGAYLSAMDSGLTNRIRGNVVIDNGSKLTLSPGTSSSRTVIVYGDITSSTANALAIGEASNIGLVDLRGNNTLTGDLNVFGQLGYGSASAFGASRVVLNQGATFGQSATIGDGTDAARALSNNILLNGAAWTAGTYVTLGGLGSANVFNGNIELNGQSRVIKLDNATTLNGGFINGTTGLTLTNSASSAGGRTLNINGASTYSGDTTFSSSGTGWKINIGNTNGSAFGSGDVIFNRGLIDGGTNSTLAGTGIIAGKIKGSGQISAGGTNTATTAGVLTVGGLDPTQGQAYAFELTAKNMVNGSAYNNDVIRSTLAGGPFTANLTSANIVDVFLNPVNLSDITAGSGTWVFGFFSATDFASQIAGATFNIYVFNATGTAKTFNALNYQTYSSFAASNNISSSYTIGTQSSTLADGTVGYATILTTTVDVPEPSTPALLMFGLAGLLGLRTLRRKA